MFQAEIGGPAEQIHPRLKCGLVVAPGYLFRWQTVDFCHLFQNTNGQRAVRLPPGDVDKAANLSAKLLGNKPAAAQTQDAPAKAPASQE